MVVCIANVLSTAFELSKAVFYSRFKNPGLPKAPARVILVLQK
jgi:hypothetical protein